MIAIALPDSDHHVKVGYELPHGTRRAKREVRARCLYSQHPKKLPKSRASRRRYADPMAVLERWRIAHAELPAGYTIKLACDDSHFIARYYLLGTVDRERSLGVVAETDLVETYGLLRMESC